jgi:hypothetical protein
MTTRLLPNALHFTEFQGGYHGTCGETALATALVCSTPPLESTADAINLMLAMTREMIGLGWASANGSTTTQRLHDEAVRRGFHPDESSRIDYSEPLDPIKLHTLLLAVAGVRPILLEIARAGNLPGDEAGVQYHFICIVGITDAGYICNDGDNTAINQHLVTYSWSELENARPCGVLVIEMQPGASTVGIPSGWSDDGVTLRNPVNANIAVNGIRYYILTHPWNPADVPLDNEFEVPQVELGHPVFGAGVIQFFRYSQLTWTLRGGPNGDNNVWQTWLGQEAAFLRTALTSAQAEVGQLSQALATAKAQPAPAPAAPAPVDPAVKAALVAAAQALAPQVTLAQELAAAVAKL